MTLINKMAHNSQQELDLKAIFDEIEAMCKETMDELNCMKDKLEESVKTSTQVTPASAGVQMKLCQRGSAAVEGNAPHSPEEYPKTSRILSKTDHVVSELITSEEDYINKLDFVCSNYEQWLNQNIGVIKTRHMMKNLAEIISESKLFLQDLKQHEDNSDAEMVAQEFLKNRSLLQKYTIYSKNQKTAESAYHQSRDKIKEREIELDDKLGLHAALLRPVQRLAKYEQLLKELQRAQDAPRPRLADAIALIQDVSQKSNSVVELEHLLDPSKFKAKLRTQKSVK